MRKLLLPFFAVFMLSVAPSFALIDKVSKLDTLNAANEETRLSGDGYGSVGFQITGTWSGTVTFEGTVNGTAWVSVYGYNRASGTGATTTTANGVFVASSGGLRYVRARMSAYTSGSAFVQGLASIEQSVMDGGGGTGGGGGGGDASADNQTSGAQKTQIVDGSGNVIASTSNALNVAISSATITTFPDNEPFNVAQIGGNAVTAGAGAVAAGTQRVTHASDDPVTTALQIIDDWDESDRAKVNPIVGQAGVAAGAGAVGATVQRVTHASDDPVTTAIQIIDNLVLAEDAVHSDGAAGAQVLAVRRDANTTLATSDGDYGPLQLNADGSLKVAITAGAGSGGTSIADDAAFTPASTSITPVGGTYISAKDAVNDGDAGAFAMTSYRAVHTYLVDANGDAVAVGGGTQYTEDAAETPAASLTLAGSVRRDTPASSAGTTGDNATLNTDANGRLWASATIDAALPAGTNAIGKLAANSGVDIGDVDVTSISAGDNNIGNVDIVTMPTVTINSPAVTNAGTFAVQATLAAGATTAPKAEDVAAADADVGMPAYAVRKATPANQSGTDGDYEPMQISAGRLWTSSTIDAALPTGANVIGALSANQSVNVAQINGVTALMGNGVTGTGSQRVTIASDNTAFSVNATATGAAAHDAAVSGSPLLAGAEARTSNGTAVANGDVTRLQATIEGKIVTKPHSVYGATWTYAAASGGITNTTAATMKAAGGAGVRVCLTGIQVINGHATVSTEVSVKDGAAGTVIHRGFAQAAGGGYAATFDVPICGTANTLMEVVPVTTGSAIYVNAQGYTSAE